MTKKELLELVKFLKHLRGILFSYEINVFSDNKNLIYAATPSESQRVMCWRLIIGKFEPTIQHISGVENIVYDTISTLSSTSKYKYEPDTQKDQCRVD